MTIAIIIAGGSGNRVGATVPKQFIEINGKPILAYTLEKFQHHDAIEKIIVVCISGWEDIVEGYREKYTLPKLEKVVTGGATALESIRRGVVAAQGNPGDILIVHDGVRPLVDKESIDNVIKDCQEFGGAISSVPLVEHIVFEGADRTDIRYIPREHAFRTITPQAYRLEKLQHAFDILDSTGKGAGSAFIGTLMMDLGEDVVLSKGSERNIKITDPRDLVYFESLL